MLQLLGLALTIREMALLWSMPLDRMGLDIDVSELAKTRNYKLQFTKGWVPN